jgi:hypothetical protein
MLIIFNWLITNPQHANAKNSLSIFVSLIAQQLNQWTKLLKTES